MDYVVIGNGIIALSAAFALKSRCTKNDTITVVASQARSCSASLAAAAMLNVFAEVDQYTFHSSVDRFKFDLCVKASTRWPSFLKEIQDSIDTSMFPAKPFGFSEIGYGTYVINNMATDLLEDINYNEIVKALILYDQDFSEIDPLRIPNYKPTSRLRSARSFFIAGVGWINPKIVLYELSVLSSQIQELLLSILMHFHLQSIHKTPFPQLLLLMISISQPINI